MRPDAAREGRRNAAVIEIEPRVLNKRLRIVDGRLVRPLLLSPLVGVLDGAKAGLL